MSGFNICGMVVRSRDDCINDVQATNRLYYKALGTIDTREKFEAKRLQLAGNE
jgi:nitrate/TMAO reductase-like tetraheme cytochrome c subunit